jgi:hypothetical protein
MVCFKVQSAASFFLSTFSAGARLRGCKFQRSITQTLFYLVLLYLFVIFILDNFLLRRTSRSAVHTVSFACTPYNRINDYFMGRDVCISPGLMDIQNACGRSDSFTFITLD